MANTFFRISGKSIMPKLDFFICLHI